MRIKIMVQAVFLPATLALYACGSSSGSDGSNDNDGASAGDAGTRAAEGQGDPASGGAGAGSGRTTQDGGPAAAGSGSGSATAGSGGSGDSSDAGDSGEEPIDMAELGLSALPDVFAQAMCEALRSCVGDAKLADLTQREACEERFAAELRATEFAYMDDAISAGRLLYEPARLDECREGIAAMGCLVLTNSFPEACTQVLKGNVELGHECAISSECAGSAFCGGDSCPTTCTALLEAGAVCSADNQCGDGLRCVGGACAEPAQQGEPCFGSSGNACELGLNCSGATQTEAGECVPNSEVQVGELGEPCMPGGALCKDGLSCAFDGAGGFACAGQVNSGGDCYPALPGMCPLDEYCDSTEITQQSSCKPLPVAGEPCVLHGLCAPGHTCLELDGEARCAAISDNGGDCDDDAACRSGHCVSGACMPPQSCL